MLIEIFIFGEKFNNNAYTDKSNYLQKIKFML